MRTEETLTTEQAAELLHMRPDSVVRLIREQKIPAVKIGKRWLIRRETLEAMLQASAPQGT